MLRRIAPFVAVVAGLLALLSLAALEPSLAAATATPEPSHPTFAELLAGWNDPALTKVQKRALIDQFKASRVTNWSGVVVDVPKVLGSYFVHVDVPGAGSDYDVALDVPQTEAVKYYKGQAITFSGKVVNVSSFLGFSVHLKEVTTQFGPTPTRTATPTRTVTPLPPTATPTPLPAATSLRELWEVWRDAARPEAERRAALEGMVGRGITNWRGTVCEVSEPPSAMITADFPGGFVCADARFQVAAGDRERFHPGQELEIAAATIDRVNVGPDGPDFALREVAWRLGIAPTSTPTLMPSITPTPAPTNTPTPQPRAKQAGNRREGPGMNYKVVGKVAAGEPLTIVGRNAAGDWFRLGNGSWVAAMLVEQAPEAPVITPEPTDTPAPAPTRAPGIGAAVLCGDEFEVRVLKKPAYAQRTAYHAAKGVYLLVDLEVTNLSAYPDDVGGGQLSIKGMLNGRELKFSTDTWASGDLCSRVGQTCYYDEIPPGVTVRTRVVFDVNPDARDLRLVVDASDLIIFSQCEVEIPLK